MTWFDVTTGHFHQLCHLHFKRTMAAIYNIHYAVQLTQGVNPFEGIKCFTLFYTTNIELSLEYYKMSITNQTATSVRKEAITYFLQIIQP